MMKRNVKTWLRLAVLLCSMVLLVSAVSMADVSPRETKTFGFSLKAAGDKNQTGYARKDNNSYFADIYFSSYENDTAYPLLYRIRNASDNAAASGLQELTGTGTQTPGYWAGYGINGHDYYLRMQTDSSSVGSDYVAGVEGWWTP